MILRQYQKEISDRGYSILKEFSIVYLSMQVRTGKTLTAFEIVKKTGLKNVLFVTTKKSIPKIQEIYNSIGGFNLTIINYELLHTVKILFDIYIIDEAHKIGQYPRPAQKVKFLKKLCKDKPIIYLSGTPSPESYSQLFHQFYISSFSPWIEYYNFYKWAKDYVTLKKKYFFNRESNDYSFADQEKIEAATSHLFISLTQEEAGFTQFIKENVLKVKMRESTYLLAKRLKNKRVYIGKNGEEILADTASKLMNKFHQIYSGTVITENGDLLGFDPTKAEFIYNHFLGKKIAIFYKFRAELELLRWAFRGKITDSPEEFNSRNDLTFISQVQSGREGIDLSSADCIVMYNIDYSSLSYIQAKARIQTMDRAKEANLYWIFSEGGIEEKIYKRVINKQNYTLSYFRKDYGIRRTDPDKKQIN